MDEPGQDESRSRLLRDPRFAVSVAVVALAVLAAAVVVVVRNASRVSVGPAAVSLGPGLRDTLMVKTQRKYRQGLVRLESRLAAHRQAAGGLSSRAVALSRFCDSMLGVFRFQSAAFETTGTAVSRREYFPTVERTYAALRDSVNAFGREAGSGAAGPDVDSLDRAFERLLSE